MIQFDSKFYQGYSEGRGQIVVLPSTTYDFLVTADGKYLMTEPKTVPGIGTSSEFITIDS